MKPENVYPSEMTITGQSSYVAAMCRKLAHMDIEEMEGLDELTSRERFILIENRTAERLCDVARALSEQVELRRKYS
jgi:hypothetical protein